MDKTYDPGAIEKKWYPHWEGSGAFKPSGDPAAEPYSIVIPPPNVTGSLHVGHALNNTLQDVLTRFERLRGKDVLWQPGTDHAGIATQMVVERQLAEEGKSRHDLGREAFIERVWEWKAQSGDTITNQLKRLGCSADWSRARFTMDEGLSRAVIKVFVEYCRQGLIYKDKRLVNWDPKLLTAISDLEVEQREVDGHFWHFRYPVEGSDEALVVATTRPETMLGDTAVAVHPEDDRYTHLVGRHVILPLVGRRIPIVADEHADPEQGSGCVKITPAHDFNDFEVGRRHDLPLVNIFDQHARINENAPETYRGMDRDTAREAVVAALEAEGLLEKVEPRRIQMPYGDRSGVVIEPWLTDQWYVDAATLAKPAIQAVRAGRTRFVPPNWEKTYFQWMENIQPWCISRQLWWGHRIPAWYGPRIENGHLQFGTEGPTEPAPPPSSFRRKPESRMPTDPDAAPEGILDPGFRRGDERDMESTESGPRSGFASGTGVVFNIEEPFVAESPEEAARQARDRYGRDIEVFDTLEEASQHYINVTSGGGTVPIWRDPDVLDTWFSSALWPFSTLGWPEKTPELARYYPTSTLVTAFDIIFFWVARMMMSGLHFREEVPFRDVYITSLVRDAKGEKMSKSKGNVIDPLDFIETYGADALRFTMTALETQGRDIKLSEGVVAGYRNFGTKLWNAARFCHMNGIEGGQGIAPPSAKLTLNRWIVGEVGKTAEAVTEALEAFRFDAAAAAIYHFTWHSFCDWYVEFIKPVLLGEDETAKAETRAVAGWALDQILVLLHPFMPFITEELWHALAPRERDLIVSRWPELRGEVEDAEAHAEIDWLIRLISQIRSARAEVNVPAGAQIPAMIRDLAPNKGGWLARNDELVRRLARLSRIEAADSTPAEGAIEVLVDEATIALAVADVIDFAEERGRLEKSLAKAEKEITGLKGRLANPQFTEKAPAEVVEQARTRLAEEQAAADKLRAALKRIG